MSEAPVIRVVDDDLSFRTAVTRLLRAAKYAVRGFASASEFLVIVHDLSYSHRDCKHRRLVARGQ